MIEYFCNCLYY